MTEPDGAIGGLPRSLAVPAALSEVDRARAFLKSALAGSPLSPDDLFELDLALVEILVNIVRYAYPDGRGEIRMTVGIEAERVTLEIRDHGLPFDPAGAPAPSLEVILGGKRKGGLGIHLARTLTDNMSYRREKGGNVLTLVKNVSK